MATDVSGAVPASLLARWDSRWKLAALVVAALMVAAMQHCVPSVAACGVGLLLLAGSGRPWQWGLPRLGLFSLAGLPFLLIVPWTLADGNVLLRFGPLALTDRGLATGVGVLARTIAIGAIALALIGSTPWPQLLAAGHAVRVPARLVVLFGLTWRYAQVLAGEYRRMRIAARCRGFQPAATRRGYQTMGHLIGAVLVHGIERAERVAAAMQSRGFDGRFHSIVPFRRRWYDPLLAAAVLLPLLALLVWDYYR